MPKKILYLNTEYGGGDYFSHTAYVVLDATTLVANKSRFKTLDISYGGMYVAQKAGSFSIWYMGGVKRASDGASLWSEDSGNYEPVYSSSSSYERWVGINFKTNWANYLSASYPVKLWLNQQQGLDSGEEVGWSTTQKPEIRLTYDLHDPTVSSVTINNATGMVDDTTTISWVSSYQTRATIIVNGAVVGSVGTQTSFVVDKRYFVVGENNVTVQVFHEYSDSILGTINKSVTASAKKTLNTLNPSVSGVNIDNDGNVVDNAFIITWQSANQHRYQILINDRLVASGGTEKTATIAGSNFIIGSNKIVIRVIKNGVSGVANSEKIVEYSTTKSYSTLKPTVSNITISNTGSLIDNDTKVSWQSTNQHRFNIYSNDKLLGSGTTATLYTIPSGTLTVGANRIRVEIIKNAVAGVAGSEQKVHYDTNKEFSRIMPNLKSLTLSGTNRDYISTLSWESSNAHEFKVYVNESLITTTNEKQVNIAEGTFLTEDNKIRVVATRNTTFDSVSVEQTISKNITQNTPLIYSLEPSNITQNVDEVIEMSFTTNDFCDRWEISIDRATYRGTTERSVKVSRNTFKKGANKIKVVTYYVPTWNSLEIRTSMRECVFTGYGKPALPTVDDTLIYNTSLPTFTWETNQQESDAQTAFEIKIIDNDGAVIEEKIVNNSVGEYTVTTSLENNAQYVVMVSIKNKYDLWSDFATKIITTSFTQLPTSEITLTQNGDSVLVSWDGEQIEEFSEVRVYRREEGGNWLEIAHALNSTDSFVDYLIKPNIKTYYKVRTYDVYNAFADSQPKEITLKMNNYNLVNIQDGGQQMTLPYTKLEVKMNNNKVVKLFAGTSKPKVYINKALYETGKVTITLENHESEQFQQMVQNGKIFCLRTWRGKKLCGFFSIVAINYPNQFLQEIILEYVEVNFNEFRMYSGKGRRKLVCLDGEYFLDGSIDLSATALEELERSVIL